MKNTHIGKNFYVISFLMALVLLGTYIYLNQTDSEENINVSENNAEVEKIISQKDEQTSDNPKIEEDQNNLPETDEIEDSQPKEIRIVAEEILYPDEYDFGDSMSEITLAVGKPVKFDARPLIHAKQGDMIEIEIGGINYTSSVNKIDLQSIYDESLPDNQGNVIVLNGNNGMRGVFGYNINNEIISGEINIRKNNGNYNLHLYKNLAYYVDEYERQKEFHKRGYKLD